MGDKGPRVDVTPQSALLDEDLQISISNLRPYQHVTILCRVQSDGAKFYSYGYYISNGSGLVDLKTMAAMNGGSYEGIEPMGLIWSQKAEPGQAPGRRLMKSDITTPIETNFYVFDGIMTVDACLKAVEKQQWTCQNICYRTYMAKGVERIEIKKGRLWGAMFIPEGPGPFPGVLDLFGTVGGLVEHRSALLASRGIASFTICYFTPGKGDGLVGDLEYFEEAIDELLRHPKVCKPYAAVIGVSKGAELALLLGALCPKVIASISIGGCNYNSLADITYKGETFQPIEFDLGLLKQDEMGMIRLKDGVNTVTMGESEACVIPVERSNCDYLIIHGEDDQCSPRIMSDFIAEHMDRYGKPNYRVLLYPDAGHLIEPPHSPHFYSTYHKMFNGVVAWGGKAKEHSRAQEASWSEIQNFIKTKLGSPRYGRPRHGKL